MSKPVISVENLSKAYRIGMKEEIPDTLVGAMTSMLKSPIKNFNRLRKLNTFSSNGEHEESDDILWALKDVSFDVHEGEVVGIIGRNGAGKSTLLKILSRITEPTTGRVVMRGRVSSLLEVGTGFHPELTGRENVYLNGTILGMTKREIDRKFDEIVDFSGVERFLDTPVKRYSSGMSVRLAFAVAAHLEPEILIIDEVLAVGDVEFQKKCLGKMQDVADQGRTVLFVSHNMAAVESLCDRGLEIAEGKLVKEGRTSEVLRHYRESNFKSSEDKNALKRAKYFKDVSLIDRDGKRTEFITLGSTFCLQLIINSKHMIRSPKIGIGIDNLSEQRLLTLHTPQINNPITIIDNEATIICEVERFPLAPGEYRIKVALTENLQELEGLEDVFRFTVTDADGFKEGRGFHRGLCVAPCDWRNLI